MNSPESFWFHRPLRVLCVLFALTGLSLVVLLTPSDGASAGVFAQTSSPHAYGITLRHFGMDAREMERSAAIPLEQALYSLPGVAEVRSASEGGMVRAMVRFSGGRKGSPAADREAAYAALLDAAYGVYGTLPNSAQRPEIDTLGEDRLPAWSAAVYRTDGNSDSSSVGALLDGQVRSRLARLPGVGDVEVYGSGIPELTLSLDSHAASILGADAASIAGIMANEDILLPAGRLFQDGVRLPILVDGRFADLRDLALMPIPLAQESAPGRGSARSRSVALPLSVLGTLTETERPSEGRSRLDAQPAAILSVIPTARADLQNLSGAIADELKTLKDLPLRFKVLFDAGAEAAASYRSVFWAAVEGALGVAAAAWFLVSASRRAALSCALSVPLMLLFSAALLKSAGFPLNKAFLAGLSAGSGVAVDALILCAERFGGPSSPFQKNQRTFGSLVPSLMGGAATTVVALLPLTTLELASDELRIIPWTIMAVTLVSAGGALCFLPPFLLGSPASAPAGPMPPPPGTSPAPAPAPLQATLAMPSRPRLFRRRRLFRSRIRRQARRLLAANLRFCRAYPGAFPLVALLASLGGGLALFASGVDLGYAGSGTTLRIQAEFEGGLLEEAVDSRLAEYAEELGRIPGVLQVQTLARSDSGSVLVGFDRDRISPEALASKARELPLTRGFVHIPESSRGERLWTILVSGDEDQVCRAIAERIAQACASLPQIRETVLDFKAGASRLVFTPDRESCAALGLPFYRLGDLARRAVFGPVAYKRLGIQGETDVRIRSAGGGEGLPTRESVLDLPLVLPKPEGGHASIPFGAVVRTSESREPSLIRREGRRRVASLSIRTQAMDPRRAKALVQPLLDSLELSPGYSVDFDREALAQAESLSRTVESFCLALLFCYLVLGACTESFGTPLGIIAVVPPSLAVPALVFYFLGIGIDANLACAFIAVAGMAVNAAVLTAEELRRRGPPCFSAMTLYGALRSRLPLLAATGMTTIVGALPFLFLDDPSNAMVRSLAMVGALGVGASLFASLTLLPSLFCLFPFLCTPLSGSASAESTSASGGLGL